MAHFKDLALDTNDQAISQAFWSAVLGLQAHPRGPGEPVALRDDASGSSQHTVWLNAVPEPKQGKSRVHLDVHVRAVEDVVALGAEVVDRSFPWTICRAPDGLEFCAFVRREVPAYRLYELVVDSADPQSLARWWADRLGVRADHDAEHPWWWIEGDGLPYEVVFPPVPEPKTGKNRVHWDVVGTVEEFTRAGARLLPGPGHDGWHVLADPEGNEFCVFPPAA